MRVLEVIAFGVVALVVLSLLLTDRWGHFVGTHNWRVSRRLDRRDRELSERAAAHRDHQEGRRG